jgi:hypothetical protein
MGRPDQEGRFRVRGLPPADYFAAAVKASNKAASGILNSRPGETTLETLYSAGR